MESKLNNPKFFKGQGKGTDLTLQFIINEVEKGTGLSLKELKNKYSEERLFAIGLMHITTTKKSFCEALRIPIEAGCRYKRTLEKAGYLVQSIDKFVCPFTKYYAHIISTNPKEFPRLLKSNTN